MTIDIVFVSYLMIGSSVVISYMSKKTQELTLRNFNINNTLYFEGQFIISVKKTEPNFAQKIYRAKNKPCDYI